MATTLISLVRLHSETMRPPRALWVPFELGRPLGPPNEPALQRRVFMAALELLTRDTGPVVHEDFVHELPADRDWTAAFTPEGAAEATPAERAARLKTEYARALLCYQDALSRGSRDVIGVSGLSAEAVADHVAAAYLALVEGQPLPPSPIRGMHPMQALRFAVDDLKACLLVAATANGAAPTCGQHNRWFWRETAAGRLIIDLRVRCLESEQNIVKTIGQSSLVTREYL